MFGYQTIYVGRIQMSDIYEDYHKTKHKTLLQRTIGELENLTKLVLKDCPKVTTRYGRKTWCISHQCVCPLLTKNISKRMIVARLECIAKYNSDQFESWYFPLLMTKPVSEKIMNEYCKQYSHIWKPDLIIQRSLSE